MIYKMQIEDHTMPLHVRTMYINRVLKKTTHAIREEGKGHRLPYHNIVDTAYKILHVLL